MIFKLLIHAGSSLGDLQRWLFTSVTCIALVALWYAAQGKQALTLLIKANQTPELCPIMPRDVTASTQLPSPLTLDILTAWAHESQVHLEGSQSASGQISIILSGPYEHRILFLQKLADRLVQPSYMLMTDTQLTLSLTTIP